MTERLSPRPSLLRETRLWYGAAIVVLTWVGIMMILNFDIFAHSPRDSYTLQALARREEASRSGRTTRGWSWRSTRATTTSASPACRRW